MELKATTNESSWISTKDFGFLNPIPLVIDEIKQEGKDLLLIGFNKDLGKRQMVLFKDHINKLIEKFGTNTEAMKGKIIELRRTPEILNPNGTKVSAKRIIV